MKTENIEISPNGNLLVYKRGYTAAFVKDTIRKNNLRGLRIFAVLKDDRLDDIDFLQDYSFLEALDITGAPDYKLDFLKSLVHLKEFSISIKGKTIIDVSAMENLETLTITWRKNVTGLSHCRKLKKLLLVEYTEKDLSVLKEVSTLEEFRIKTGSLLTLEGLENNLALKIVELGYCKSLTSVKALNDMKNLRRISIEKCGKIDDYDRLTSLPSLADLELVDCGKIASIKFIIHFPQLIKLSLLGNTEVGDGDLIPAKNVLEVFHVHKSYYNVRIENKDYDNLIQSNLKKIKDMFRKQ